MRQQAAVIQQAEPFKPLHGFQTEGLLRGFNIDRILREMDVTAGPLRPAFGSLGQRFVPQGKAGVQAEEAPDAGMTGLLTDESEVLLDPGTGLVVPVAISHLVAQHR